MNFFCSSRSSSWSKRVWGGGGAWPPAPPRFLVKFGQIILALPGADLGGGERAAPLSSGNHSEKNVFANCKIKHFAFSECRKCHFQIL